MNDTKSLSTRSLCIWMNGETVGRWTVGPANRHSFQYEQSWVESNAACPLSLSMPLRRSELVYRGSGVEAFFDNLLPDSADTRRCISLSFGAESSRAFDLLEVVGRDCAGAVELYPDGKHPESVQRTFGEQLSDGEIAALIREAKSSAFSVACQPPRVALPGAQRKTALVLHEGCWHRPTGITPTTHIFKLPLGKVGNMQADFSSSVENEWLCAQIARELALPVADCEIADFEDQHVLIVKRFDRKLSKNGWWLRLPQEDLCQATGTPPGQRYEADGGPGISRISSVLLGSRQADLDRRNFFRAQVLFWMLCATDGHAKNFSLFIEPQGRYSSSPLYDILSAYPILGTGANQLAPQRAKMAMAVRGKNRHYGWAEIQPRHWLSTAESIGLGATARTDMGDLAERVPRAVDAVGDRLPAGFPAYLAETIFAGLRKSAERLSSALSPTG